VESYDGDKSQESIEKNEGTLWINSHRKIKNDLIKVLINIYNYYYKELIKRPHLTKYICICNVPRKWGIGYLSRDFDRRVQQNFDNYQYLGYQPDFMEFEWYDFVEAHIVWDEDDDYGPGPDYKRTQKGEEKKKIFDEINRLMIEITKNPMLISITKPLGTYCKSEEIWDDCRDPMSYSFGVNVDTERLFYRVEFDWKVALNI
jgi:hypothetical protein